MSTGEDLDSEISGEKYSVSTLGTSVLMRFFSETHQIFRLACAINCVTVM